MFCPWAIGANHGTLEWRERSHHHLGYLWKINTSHRNVFRKIAGYTTASCSFSSKVEGNIFPNTWREKERSWEKRVCSIPTGLPRGNQQGNVFHLLFTLLPLNLPPTQFHTQVYPLTQVGLLKLFGGLVFCFGFFFGNRTRWSQGPSCYQGSFSWKKKRAWFAPEAASTTQKSNDLMLNVSAIYHGQIFFSWGLQGILQIIFTTCHIWPHHISSRYLADWLNRLCHMLKSPRTGSPGLKQVILQMSMSYTM